MDWVKFWTLFFAKASGHPCCRQQPTIKLVNYFFSIGHCLLIGVPPAKDDAKDNSIAFSRNGSIRLVLTIKCQKVLANFKSLLNKCESYKAGKPKDRNDGR
jgi:hypothetical protein